MAQLRDQQADDKFIRLQTTEKLTEIVFDGNVNAHAHIHSFTRKTGEKKSSEEKELN